VLSKVKLAGDDRFTTGVFPVPLRLRASLPVLVRVMACVADAVFTGVLAKVKLLVDNLTAEAVFVCGDLAASGDVILEFN
jgi:hypothetical protein